MQFYTRLAVLCLFAGVSASALGQTTNAPTTSPTLTPEAEKRARQLLESIGQGTPATPTLQEREAARKRAEAEARQRLEEQKKKQAVPTLAAPAAQSTVEGDREQRERELKRIEAEVEKARKTREPATTPQPAPRAPAAPASAPAASEGSPLSNTLTPDAEIRAREVLNQRTAEIKVNPPKPTVTAAPPVARPPVAAPVSIAPAPAVAAPAPVQPQAPVTVTAPVVAAPLPTPSAPTTTPTLSAEQETAARDLINRTLGRPQVITPAPATVAAPAVTAPPPAVVAPRVTTPAPAPVVTTAPATVAVTPPVAVPTPAAAPSKPLTAEQEAAARAAVDQRMFEITGVRPGTVPPPTVKAPEAVSATPRTGQVSPASTPATAPVPVVSATAVTRAQKLSALLEAYKADRITPNEYHAQRAKILAETQP